MCNEAIQWFWLFLVNFERNLPALKSWLLCISHQVAAPHQWVCFLSHERKGDHVDHFHDVKHTWVSKTKLVHGSNGKIPHMFIARYGIVNYVIWIAIWCHSVVIWYSSIVLLFDTKISHFKRRQKFSGPGPLDANCPFSFIYVSQRSMDHKTLWKIWVKIVINACFLSNPTDSVCTDLLFVNYNNSRNVLGCIFATYGVVW